ncbi:MAG: hypothetical protein JNN07_08910 [Verrucomicrobiales bacterium]|nr:hypothetical protein [Verrucomicrobiales bacterium]
MKKIITSAGLVALSATGMQGAYAPGLNKMESSKLMTYSASLRGFYDDNVTTATGSSTAPKIDSFGFDFRPSASLNLTSLQQTYIGATYTYGMRYYADRDPSADHSHEFDLKTEHAFNERYKMTFNDSFVYAQEPEVVGDIGVVRRLARSDNSAYRNVASLGFTAQLTEVIGARLGYENTWLAYLDEGAGSRSAQLDRMDHAIRLEGTWQVQPKLLARSGYRLTITDYQGSDDIDLVTPGIQQGDTRNENRHTFFVGGDYSFNSRLRASLEGGAQIAEFKRADLSSDVSPYVSLSSTYLYQEDCYAQLGLTVDRSATDIVSSADVQTMSPYFSINHKITPRINAGGLLRYNQFKYHAPGAAVDGGTENFITAQLNVDYKISQYFTATATYNFDDLGGDTQFADRSFTRNRVFLGVRATY